MASTGFPAQKALEFWVPREQLRECTGRPTLSFLGSDRNGLGTLIFHDVLIANEPPESIDPSMRVSCQAALQHVVELARLEPRTPQLMLAAYHCG